MDIEVDQPRMLGLPAALEKRRQALNAPHMQWLVEFAGALAKESPAGVPHFDPWDGGIEAECLFLLEAPGRRALGSNFVSRNNPDQTAENFFEVNIKAALDRRRTITWNAVPWYIGDAQRIRAANAEDLRGAAPSLRELLKHLKKLRVVVLLGKKAQRCKRAVAECKSDVKIFECPHPSPLSFNRDKRRREQEAITCLKEVVTCLDSLF